MTPPPAAASDDAFPLSLGQQALWFDRRQRLSVHPVQRFVL